MKTMWRIVACVLLIYGISGVVLGQSQDNPKKDSKSVSISAKDMNKRLVTDINKRFPQSQDAPIVWDNTEFGYDATYSYDNTSFMSRYDLNGNYLGTLQKKEWSQDNVPEDVRALYDNSKYREYKVEGYWQSSNPEIDGYYMELKNPKGQKYKVWVDENKQLSEKPRNRKDN